MVHQVPVQFIEPSLYLLIVGPSGAGPVHWCITILTDCWSIKCWSSSLNHHYTYRLLVHQVPVQFIEPSLYLLIVGPSGAGPVHWCITILTDCWSIKYRSSSLNHHYTYWLLVHQVPVQFIDASLYLLIVGPSSAGPVHWTITILIDCWSNKFWSSSLSHHYTYRLLVHQVPVQFIEPSLYLLIVGPSSTGPVHWTITILIDCWSIKYRSSSLNHHYTYWLLVHQVPVQFIDASLYLLIVGPSSAGPVHWTITILIDCWSIKYRSSSLNHHYTYWLLVHQVPVQFIDASLYLLIVGPSSAGPVHWTITILIDCWSIKYRSSSLNHHYTYWLLVHQVPVQFIDASLYLLIVGPSSAGPVNWSITILIDCWSIKYRSSSLIHHYTYRLLVHQVPVQFIEPSLYL